MYVCILDQNSELLVHRTMQTSPEAFLNVIAPYRPGMVVAGECLFPWYWLADLCADAGIPFVLGHALSMKAIPGGKANNDPSDSHKIAALLRGGMLPPASVSPAAMRATRDLLRRRRPLAHKRPELLAHVHKTHSQYHRPAIGNKRADKAKRDGVAKRLAAPAVPKSIEVDLALITSDDALRRDVARPSVTTARHPEAHTLSLLQTVPGIGKMLSLVLLYDIHDMARCPRVQDCLASGRLVPCARASAGKRYGTSGTTIGKAHRPWAFAEAAVLVLRAHPAAQPYLARLEKQHGKGTALTLLAQTLARAVSSLRKRHVAFERATFLQCYGRGADEPDASLDHKGANRQEALDTAASTAAWKAQAPRGQDTLSPVPLIGPPLTLLFDTVLVANGLRGLLLTRA
jgi:transposase